MNTQPSPTVAFEEIDALPSLPGIVDSIISATNSPDSSARDVADILMADQSIAAKVLRIANSPFFGATQKVTQISRAVVMLGSISVKNLVVSLCTKEALSALGTENCEHIHLWRHSIATATAADLIAHKVKYDPPEEAFLAGLLHDIGKLAAVAFRPAAFRRTIVPGQDDTKALDTERKHLGCDHTEIGAAILDKWRLPSLLRDVVKNHHEEDPPKNESSTLQSIIALADALAAMLGYSLDDERPYDIPLQKAAERLELTPTELVTSLAPLRPRIAEAGRMFGGIDMGKDKSQDHNGRVCWVSNSSELCSPFAEFILRHAGYTIHHARPENLHEECRQGDLIITYLSGQLDNAQRVAEGLCGMENTSVAVIDENATQRSHDAQTGLFTLKPAFSCSDISWIEEMS